MQFILSLMIAWILSAIAIMATSAIMPGMSVDGFGAAMIAAFILAVIYTFLFPLLAVLSLPITVLTLGLFLFVLNGAMLMLTSSLMQGFEIQSWLAAIVGAVVLTVMESLFKWLTPGV